VQPFSVRPLREGARVPGFCTAKGFREQNRVRVMHRAQPRNGTTRCRAGPKRPRPFVASERAGESRLQGLTRTLPSDPSRQARTPEGFGGAYRLSRLAQ